VPIVRNRFTLSQLRTKVLAGVGIFSSPDNARLLSRFIEDLSAFKLFLQERAQQL
jgi:hypothetical protein